MRQIDPAERGPIGLRAMQLDEDEDAELLAILRYHAARMVERLEAEEKAANGVSMFELYREDRP